MLFVFASFYLCFLSFKKIVHPPTWNALFWVIMLFSAINIASKSFLQDGRGRNFYIGTLVNPQQLLLAKIIYNAFLILLTNSIGFLVYSIILGNLAESTGLFMLTIVLGSIGFSVLLTTSSLIASKASYNFTLMSVLSLPLLIPYLVALIKASKIAVEGLDPSLAFNPMIILVAINVIFLSLGYLLIPYLWRD